MIKPRQINKQDYDEYIKSGLTHLQAQLLSSRISYNPNWLNPKINIIPNFNKIPKVISASKRIVKAIQSNQKILLYTDYDCDGCCSMAILYQVLLDFGVNKHNLIMQLGNKKSGYGITDEITNKIISQKPDLVITADCGISDYQNIDIINSCNIDVIVTDHHLLPQQIPNCYIVNPQMFDYDKNICGCAVAWLLMISLSFELELPIKKRKQLLNYLDYVAIATIADMVSMDSIVNRFFVIEGLKIINQKNRLCWQVLPDNIDEDYIGFQLAPKINCVSRLYGSPSTSIDYLLGNDINCIEMDYDMMERYNNQRKQIESEMMSYIEPEKDCIVNYNPNNHTGVQGITAGKLMYKYNIPVILFADIGDNKLVGSGRSPSIHLRNALEYIDNNFKGIIETYGGHFGACGLVIYKDKFDDFKTCFKEVVERLDKPNKEILIDVVDSIDINTYNQIKSLKPFGMNYRSPIFAKQMTISKMKVLKEEHLSCCLDNHKAIWFNYNKDLELQNKQNVKVLYTISLNTYQGRTNLQLMIQDIIK